MMQGFVQGFVQGLRKGSCKALAVDFRAFARVAIVSCNEGSRMRARAPACAEGAQNPCNLCNPCKAKHHFPFYQSLSDFDRAWVAQGFDPFVQGLPLQSINSEVSMSQSDLTNKLASTAICETSEPAQAVGALMGAIAAILHPRLGPFGTFALLRDVVADAEAVTIANVGLQAGERVQ